VAKAWYSAKRSLTGAEFASYGTEDGFRGTITHNGDGSCYGGLIVGIQYEQYMAG